jgi:hypothetical protein
MSLDGVYCVLPSAAAVGRLLKRPAQTSSSLPCVTGQPHNHDGSGNPACYFSLKGATACASTLQAPPWKLQRVLRLLNLSGSRTWSAAIQRAASFVFGRYLVICYTRFPPHFVQKENLLHYFVTFEKTFLSHPTQLLVQWKGEQIVSEIDANST